MSSSIPELHPVNETEDIDLRQDYRLPGQQNVMKMSFFSVALIFIYFTIARSIKITYFKHKFKYS